MKLLSLNIGMPEIFHWQGREISTGFFKKPNKSVLELKTLGFVGDGQADLSVHGGIDKAVYGIGQEVYARWRVERPNDQLDWGSFGENLSLSSCEESKIFVGDIFKLGSAKLQAVQPRFPCFKLGLRFKDMTTLKVFNDIGRPGVYFRVLSEGQVKAGDHLEFESGEQGFLSISKMFLIGIKKENPSVAELEQFLKISALDNRWREKFLNLKNEKS